MNSETAKRLVVVPPVLVLRGNPSVVLKYQTDTTGFAAPENLAVSSGAVQNAVAVREEFEGTAIATSTI